MIRSSHDVVVVGAGATGLAAAIALTERGRSVLLVDAGPPIESRREQARRSSDPGASALAIDESLPRWAVPHTRHLFVDDDAHPYTTPEGRPFHWVRGRQLGGRLQTWGRVSLRMTDRELAGHSRDGLGVDWPLGYAELEPFYRRVERLLRVCGQADGGEVVPDGEFVAPLPPGPGEDAFRAALGRIAPGQRVLAGRLALTNPVSLVRQAEKSGLLTIRPNSIVTRIETDLSTGRATGVVVVDTAHGASALVPATTVCLGASSIESVRILLDSAGPRHPDGLGNSSGTLGRYLLDHLTVMACGIHDKAPVDDSLDAALAGAAYCHIPSVMPDDPRALARPFGVQLSIYRGIPRVYPRMFAPMIEEAVRRRAVPFWIQSFGEVLPRADNRVTLSERRDRWTARVPTIDFRYSDAERALAANMARTMRAMAEAAGFTVLYDDLAALCPGASAHELGGARMGTSSADSVVRADHRLWDADNVYVVDGACWPSSGWQNPTLTMMALALRAAEHIAASLARV